MLIFTVTGKLFLIFFARNSLAPALKGGAPHDFAHPTPTTPPRRGDGGSERELCRSLIDSQHAAHLHHVTSTRQHARLGLHTTATGTRAISRGNTNIYRRVHSVNTGPTISGFRPCTFFLRSSHFVATPTFGPRQPHIIGH